MIRRREFLGMLAASGAAGLMPAAHGMAAPSSGTVFVTAHGADPAGTKDSTRAVRAAIERLPAEGGVLEFPKGTYRFEASEEQAFTLRGLKRVTVRGNGSTLLFNGATKPFFVDQCDGFAVRDLAVDWARLPYSQGTVTEVGDKSFLIRIDPEFPVTGKEPIQAIGDYDRATRQPMVNGIDSYHSVRAVALTAPQTLRVDLKAPLPVKVGSTLVLRHLIYDVHGFVIHRSSGIEFDKVDMFAMPGFGVLAVDCDGLRFERVRTVLKPGTNRLMSLCADSLHMTDCTGTIEVDHCAFQGMGDDAINVCSAAYIVAERTGPRSIRVKTDKNTAIAPWRFRTDKGPLQICERTTQRVLATADLVRSTGAEADGAGAELTFAADLPASVVAGTVVCSAQEMTHTSIRNSTFTGNRARGILLHKNGVVEGNTFDGCSLAAILVAADMTWLEGPIVSDVRIARNHFTNCYYAHANDRRGTITVDTAHDRAKPMTPAEIVNRNVTIEGNTFGTSPGAAIYCAGVAGVTIERNDLGQTETMGSADAGAVILRNSSDAMVMGNRAAAGAVVLAIDCAAPIRSENNEGLRVVQAPIATMTHTTAEVHP